MNIKSIPLYYRTIRHLKPSQIAYRLLLRFKQRIVNKKAFQKSYFDRIPEIQPVRNRLREEQERNFRTAANTFTFLNKTIDTNGSWFPPSASQLWTYNLHYFDWLFEVKDWEEYIHTIHDWIKNVSPGTKDAWHPYTVSLRVCNWIWSFSARSVSPDTPPPTLPFFNSLYNQLCYIERFLEFDVLGNHLVENCKALVIGGVFFKNERWLRKGLAILKRQLDEQILPDGGHYERSPLYHCIVLEDCIAIYDTLKIIDDPFCSPLEYVITKMARFLTVITYNDDNFPLFNDSAYGIASTPTLILQRCNKIMGTSVASTARLASEGTISLFYDTGLFVYSNPKMKLFFDGGKISPDFLPAHAHNDLLGYTLVFNDEAIVTDSGVYEYTAGEWRNYFRSTLAHSTIMFDHEEQNEIWGSFRVGRRGYPQKLSYDRPGRTVVCCHNCYGHRGVLISRSIRILDNEQGIIVHDTIENKGLERPFINSIHFAPGIKVTQKEQTKSGQILRLQSGGNTYTMVIDNGYNAIEENISWYAPEFSVKIERLCIRLKGSVPKGERTFGYMLLNGEISKEQIGLVSFQS